MKNEEIKSVCQKALDYYGTSAQVDKALEEMGELTTALMKFKHGSVKDKAVITKIADVIVMTYQMSLLFGTDEVNDEISRKVERLKESISDKKANVEFTWYYGG